MKNLINSFLDRIFKSRSKKRADDKFFKLGIMRFMLTEISTDPTYGYSRNNPIEVGGAEHHFGVGPLYERRFLDAIAGPNGETVHYKRTGNCLPVDDKSRTVLLLDIYQVSWEGCKEPVSIYIDMYTYGELKAPLGFTIKNITTKS